MATTDELLDQIRAKFAEMSVHLTTQVCERDRLQAERDEARSMLVIKSAGFRASHATLTILKNAQGWRPVTETEPAQQTMVLVTCAGFVHLAHRDSGGWVFSQANLGWYRPSYLVTAWQPLPPPASAPPAEQPVPVKCGAWRAGEDGPCQSPAGCTKHPNPGHPAWETAAQPEPAPAAPPAQPALSDEVRALLEALCMELSSSATARDVANQLRALLASAPAAPPCEGCARLTAELDTERKHTAALEKNESDVWMPAVAERDAACAEPKTSIDQPPPVENPASIEVWPKVIADLQEQMINPGPLVALINERNEVTPLKTFNGHRADLDALAEALDLTVYLRQWLEELSSQNDPTRNERAAMRTHEHPTDLIDDVEHVYNRSVQLLSEVYNLTARMSIIVKRG